MFNNCRGEGRACPRLCDGRVPGSSVPGTGGRHYGWNAKGERRRVGSEDGTYLNRPDNGRYP